jgi:hypothetical protein
MSDIFLDQIVNDNLAAVHPSQSITPLGPRPPGKAQRGYEQRKTDVTTKRTASQSHETKKEKWIPPRSTRRARRKKKTFF